MGEGFLVQTRLSIEGSVSLGLRCRRQTSLVGLEDRSLPIHVVSHFVDHGSEPYGVASRASVEAQLVVSLVLRDGVAVIAKASELPARQGPKRLLRSLCRLEPASLHRSPGVDTYSKRSPRLPGNRLHAGQRLELSGQAVREVRGRIRCNELRSRTTSSPIVQNDVRRQAGHGACTSGRQRTESNDDRCRTCLRGQPAPLRLPCRNQLP